MADPFPLFQLSDLDFDVSAEAIPLLPAYQLALAPWSTAWSEALEPALKRTWRRKPERSRVQINNKVPCGVFASDDDRKKEPLFPKFELIPLDFDLSAGEAALPHLTSAQLAVVQFHPNGTKDLTLAAEDIFFSRRERDFAAGLSLPQNGESLPASVTVPVPAPAPEPEPVAAPATPPPAAAAAPPSAPATDPVASVAAAPVAAPTRASCGIFPGTLSAGDVDAWVGSTVAATTGASVHPVGIKVTSRANQDKTPNQDPRVTLAFVTFQDEAEARQVIDAADKKHYGNRVILASGIRDIPERRTWRWSDFTPDFVEEQYRQRLEQYEARGAALQGAPGSYSHASLPSRPVMVPSAQQFPIEMQNGGAASSSYAAAPAAGADPAIRLSELPDHLVIRLSVLYVTNVPTTVTLSEARTFLDDCDDPRADMATVWTAFEASADRQKATQRLHNARFPGSPKKLWFESAEGRARKTGEGGSAYLLLVILRFELTQYSTGHIWIWQNMSRDYRQRHGGPGTSSSQGPGSPAGFRTAMPPHFPAQAGYGDYRSPMPIARSGHMPEVAPYETMPMLPPGNGSGYAIPMSSAPAYEAFPQGPMAGASEKAYSPTQPHMNLLRSSFLGMSPPAPAPPSYSISQAGPAEAVPVTTTVHTAAAGNISPERLAILQASLEAAGYSPGAAGPSVSDPRPDAATEKQQAEEAARLAWTSRRRTSMNGGPTANGDMPTRDPRLNETRQADAILHIKGAAQSDSRPPSPSKSSVAASSQVGHQAQSPWNDSGSANPTAGAGPTNAEDTTIADMFISEALRVDLTPQVSQDTAGQPVPETPQPSMEGPAEEPAEGASSQAPSEAVAPEAPQVSTEQTSAGKAVD